MKNFGRWRTGVYVAMALLTLGSAAVSVRAQETPPAAPGAAPGPDTVEIPPPPGADPTAIIQSDIWALCVLVPTDADKSANPELTEEMYVRKIAVVKLDNVETQFDCKKLLERAGFPLSSLPPKTAHRDENGSYQIEDTSTAFSGYTAACVAPPAGTPGGTTPVIEVPLTEEQQAEQRACQAAKERNKLPDGTIPIIEGGKSLVKCGMQAILGALMNLSDIIKGIGALAEKAWEGIKWLFTPSKTAAVEQAAGATGELATGLNPEQAAKVKSKGLTETVQEWAEDMIAGAKKLAMDGGFMKSLFNGDNVLGGSALASLQSMMGNGEYVCWEALNDLQKFQSICGIVGYLVGMGPAALGKGLSIAGNLISKVKLLKPVVNVASKTKGVATKVGDWASNTKWLNKGLFQVGKLAVVTTKLSAYTAIYGGVTPAISALTGGILRGYLLKGFGVLNRRVLQPAVGRVNRALGRGGPGGAPAPGARTGTPPGSAPPPSGSSGGSAGSSSTPPAAPVAAPPAPPAPAPVAAPPAPAAPAPAPRPPAPRKLKSSSDDSMSFGSQPATPRRTKAVSGQARDSSRQQQQAGSSDSASSRTIAAPAAVPEARPPVATPAKPGSVAPAAAPAQAVGAAAPPATPVQTLTFAPNQARVQRTVQQELSRQPLQQPKAQPQAKQEVQNERKAGRVQETGGSKPIKLNTNEPYTFVIRSDGKVVFGKSGLSPAALRGDKGFYQSGTVKVTADGKLELSIDSAAGKAVAPSVSRGVESTLQEALKGSGKAIVVIPMNPLQ